MTCPKCEAHGCVKDGIVKGRQRYLCHACEYRLRFATAAKVPPSNARPWSCTSKGSGFGPLAACSTVAMWPSTPGSRRLGNPLTPCVPLPGWP